jgi:hypothetical protein
MRFERALLIIATLGGALLTFIGVRYLLVPESAARTFGVPARPTGHELYSIIGLRNVWLGLLVVGMALLRQWRALALWFAGGAIVCFADAGIAARALGELPQVAFHVGCGLCCSALFPVLWRAGTSQP